MMIKIVVLCVAMISQLLQLQTAQAAQPLGRLFTSPAERNVLNNLRQTRKILVVAPATEPIQQVEPLPVILPDAINMQGYVKRSDGKQGTVWINNKAMQENSGNKDVQIGNIPENGNRIPLKLPANGRRITLKAGQVYDPDSNQVSEARSNGAQGDSGTIDENSF